MRIFLDTTALIYLTNNPKAYISQNTFEFYTFEKCLYEFKNGLKRKFVDRAFIINAIKNEIKTDEVENQLAFKIIRQILSELELNNIETKRLIEGLKKVDLKYEFGIAEEYDLIDLKEMESDFYKSRETQILRVKQFYKLVKPFLRNKTKEIDKAFKELSIQIIYYEL